MDFPVSLPRTYTDILYIQPKPKLRDMHKGASSYDVRIGGGRGSWNSGRRKGVCVNFLV